MAASTSAKLGFVSGVRRFVNGTPRRSRALLTVGGGTVLMTIGGPFGTGSMSLYPRFGFWATLIVLNFTLWEVWFVLLKRYGIGWRRILLFGLPLAMLLLPFEVDIALRVFAGSTDADHLGIFMRAAAIGLLWVMAILLLDRRKAATEGTRPRFPGTAFALADIAALVAEDHYVRLHLAGGRQHLLHGRFADAVAAMQGIAGEQVNRGAWVADAHRDCADFRDRKWFVRTGEGIELPVSRSHAPRLREAGWLVKAG